MTARFLLCIKIKPMKTNDPLSKRSLIALCEMTKLSKGNSIRDFLNNLAPKWPEGKQILHDLLINNDMWVRVAFTYRTLSYTTSKTVYEIRISVVINPKDSVKFLKLTQAWHKQRPPDGTAEDDLFKGHIVQHQKVFGMIDSLDYLKKNYGTLIYSYYFYSERQIKKRS